MRINFNKIIIDNFLSFGHAEQSFQNRGYVSVVGVNNRDEDAATSNGSGKSSLFNAVCYALTGKTIQGISSNLNNIYTNRDMSVTLYFSVNDTNYIITRGKDNKGHPNLNIIINGEDKSGKTFRESEQILEEYLPDITSELIGETIIIGQGMPYKFSDNSPSARKDNLEDFSHGKVSYEEISLKVDTRMEALTVNKKSLTDTLIQLDTKVNMLRSRETSLLNKQEQLACENIDQLKSIKNELSEELEEIDKQINQYEENINILTNQLQTLSNGSSETLEKNTSSLMNIEKSHNATLQILNEQIINASNDIKTKEQLINSTVCPMCGQKLPHKDDVDIEKNKEELIILKKNLEDLNQQKINNITEYEAGVKELKEAINKEQAVINTNRSDINIGLNEDRACLTASRLKQIDLTNRLRGVEFNIQNINKEKEATAAELTEVRNQIESTNKEIESYNEKLEELQAHIDIVTKMKTQVSRDFRGYLLGSTIKYIDDKCKEYALEIFGNDKLDFVLNGNNIDITYQDKPLENLSGGEQQKVNLIIQFAIRDMVQEFTGFSTNILILDEILDNLDGMGCNKVLDFISYHLTNIESIFIISHHADSLNIGNDSIIKIIKDENGISRIE